jgi:hypothetical protein
MASRRTFAALALVQLLAAVGFAQDAELRGSSGVIKLVTKAPKQFSGTLGISFSGSPGYHASAGGPVLEDRLWFFAAGEHQALQLRSPGYAKDWDTSFLSLRLDSGMSDNKIFSATVTQQR